LFVDEVDRCTFESDLVDLISERLAVVFFCRRGLVVCRRRNQVRQIDFTIAADCYMDFEALGLDRCDRRLTREYTTGVDRDIEVG
jgi:hypothetical protein